MKTIMRGQYFLAPLLAAMLGICAATTATAVEFAIDTAQPNGLTRIYSTTFDAPLNDTPADPFFGGTPPVNQAITISPSPSGVFEVADTSLCVQAFDALNPGAPPVIPPCATLYPVATPSALDLTLSAGNTQVTVNGGNVFLQNLSLIINDGDPDQTDVVAEGASFINLVPSGAVPLDGNGVAVIEVDVNPGIAADFSTFVEIVTGCTGPLCALIPILTLDMQRYRLTIDWDPTFTFFTADFIGQTANNSMVFATLNSVVPAPEITVTDTVAPVDDLQVSFGDVGTGASADETVTVTNDGDADLTVDQITQPAAPFSVLSDTCSNQTLAPAADCTMTVRFAPASTGAASSSFDIPSDAADENLVTVAVDGTGVAPAISVSDSVAPANDLLIPYGDVTVATTADETLTVSNSGTADLNIGQIVAPAAPFSVLNDNCSNQTVAPAANCTLTVRFAPTVAGVAADTVDIPSNDAANPITVVDVNGTGIVGLVPRISVTDSVAPAADQQVPFGDVIVAPPVPFDETVTVTSVGTADLMLGQLTLPGAPFSILNDTCSNQTLTPAADCTLTVRFEPIAAGGFVDSFDIPSNDTGNPTATVGVSGTGALPTITVTDSVAPDDDLQIPFGNVIEMTTAVETVTVSNNSTVDLTLGQTAIADPLGPFSILTDNCASPQNIIAPGNTCTIDVQFLPDSVNNFAGSLSIPSNDPITATATVVVDGAGVSGFVPDISVTDQLPPVDDLMLPFGDVTEGTAWDRPVTITNDGADNLTIGMIGQVDTLADPFSILSDACSAQIIAPAASCIVQIRFLPGSAGVFTDSFDIPSDDPDESMLTFSVNGNGVVLGAGTISLEPEGSDSGPFGSALRPFTLLALFALLVAANLRRRHRYLG